MNHFAIIETGGKQYKVKPGDKVKIEKIDAEEGKPFSFDKVLLVVDDKGVKIGTPYVAGASVETEVSSVGRHDKKIIFRYHSKTRYRKLKGHRQHYTEVLIKNVKI